MYFTGHANTAPEDEAEHIGAARDGDCGWSGGWRHGHTRGTLDDEAAFPAHRTRWAFVNCLHAAEASKNAAGLSAPLLDRERNAGSRFACLSRPPPREASGSGLRDGPGAVVVRIVVESGVGGGTGRGRAHRE